MDHPHGRHGHDEVPSEGHGSDASEEGICLGDHGPGWSLAPCCFAFFSFLQNNKPNKQLLKVRLFAEVCGWIVELLEQGSNRFLSLKSLKTIISSLKLLAGIICSFFFCKL